MALFPARSNSKWRPAAIFEYSNGRMAAMGGQNRFMFGSRVGFSGSADRMAPFLVRSNPG